MYKKIFQSEVKNLLRSKTYLLFLLLNAVLTAVSLSTFSATLAANNYYRFFRFGFFELLVFASTFILAVIAGKSPNRLAEITFADKGCQFIAKFTAYFVFELPLLIYPIVYSLVNSNYLSDTIYTASAVLLHTSRLFVVILFAHTCGFVISYLTKNTLSVLLVLPLLALFSVFNNFVLGVFGLCDEMGDLIPSLFSFNMLFGELPLDTYAGPRFDVLNLCKNLNFVFFCLSVVLVMFFFLRRKKASLSGIIISVSAAACAVLCITSVCTFIKLFPTEYDYTYHAILSPDSPEATGDHIIKCAGEVTLGEWSEFSVDISAEDRNDDDMITFGLDDCFEIKEISANGKALRFDRNGKIVNIFDADVTETIRIKYRGRPFYKTDTSNGEIHTSAFCGALPVGFAFLPITGSGDTTEYDLNVKAKNTVVSNLSCDYSDGYLGATVDYNTYRFKGESSAVCMFYGYFDSFEKDGVTVYHGKYDDLSDYENEGFIRAFRYRKRNYSGSGGDKLQEVSDNEKRNCKKLFLIYYTYHSSTFPCYFDNCVYYGYGMAQE